MLVEPSQQLGTLLYKLWETITLKVESPLKIDVLICFGIFIPCRRVVIQRTLIIFFKQLRKHSTSKGLNLEAFQIRGLGLPVWLPNLII